MFIRTTAAKMNAKIAPTLCCIQGILENEGRLAFKFCFLAFFDWLVWFVVLGCYFVIS